MAANAVIARRDLANGAISWEGGRKVVFLTVTGATTVPDDTGAYTVVDMKAPSHAVVPGFSAAISGSTLTLTSQIDLGTAVVHGVLYSTPGDI